MTSWIPLLVRQEDYTEFATQVASREVGRADSVVIPSVASGPVATTAGATKEAELLATLKSWSMEALRQLAESSATFATADRWGKAMDVMCNHVGEFISSDQLAAEAGMPINHWRDAPRKLPSHLAKHYDPNIEWPLKAVGGRVFKKEDQVYWGITAEQAQRWLQVRAQAVISEIPPMTSDGN
jgi:hypothetical protein